MKKTRKEVKLLLDYFTEQRDTLPKFSKLGTDNHSEIDELKNLFIHYLSTGDIPNMSNYLEETSWSYALWLIGRYPIMDDIIEEILNDC